MKYVIVGDTALGEGEWTGSGWTLDGARWPPRIYGSRSAAQRELESMTCREETKARVRRKAREEKR